MKINLEALLKSLPMMGYGMLGIFIVIGVLMALIFALGQIFPDKPEQK